MSAFDDFWAACPNRQQKITAHKAFEKLGLHLPLNRTLLERIIQDVAERYRGVEKKMIPHPSTYLNQRRWEDEDMPSQLTGTNGGGPYRVGSNPGRQKLEKPPTPDERARVKAEISKLIQKWSM